MSRNDLLQQLVHHGWELATVEKPFESEHRFSGIWLLHSFWSPRGFAVYLVFWADWVWDDSESVSASIERPQYGHYWPGGEQQLCLHYARPADVSRFMETLNTLRNAGK